MIEGKNVEFKREYMDDIKYAVIAFANTNGGNLYIGINDDGTIYGVDNVDDTMLRLTNMIRDIVRPDVTMFTDYSVEKMEHKDVIVLTVQRGTARPYYLHSKGIRPEGVYVRQGAVSVPASETAILNMIRETSGDCYEDARSINQQLTFEKAKEYFAKKKVEFGDAQKRTLNIIGEDGTYTNLGMLLSDQCTHTIKMAVFEGSKKSVFKDRKELTGSTLISIFDGRIEFVTIGGLVRGISYDDIMLGVSALRNKKLANVFYRLKLIEAYGTGIMKINECYADQAVKPIIEVSNNAFKITLPNLNYHQEMHEVGIKNERMKMVLSLFGKKNSIVRKDVDDLLGVSQSTSSILLREMLDNGLIVKVGSGRNLKYRLKIRS